MRKFLIFIILFTLGSVLLTGCNDNTLTNNDNKQENSTNNKNDIKEQINTIYSDDDGINKFLSLYNKLYKDNLISSDSISKTQDHGSTHNNQVNITINNVMITLTNKGKSNKQYRINIYLNNYSNKPEELKDVFSQIIKVFDNNIDNSTIDEYWNKISETYTNHERFNNIEIDSSVTKYSDENKIDYISLTSKISE